MKMIQVTTDNDIPTLVNADWIAYAQPVMDGNKDRTVLCFKDGESMFIKMSFGQFQTLLYDRPVYGVGTNGMPKRSFGDDGQLPSFGNPARGGSGDTSTFGLQRG